MLNLAFVVIVALFAGALMDRGCTYHASYKAPGTPTADVFHDDGEWYSQDGCWHLQDAYWRPLRPCHVVRVPADSGVSWAAGQEGPTYRKVGP